MATITYYPRTDKIDKRGFCPVRIKIQECGSPVYHQVPSVKINPEYWKTTDKDDKPIPGRVTDDHPNAKVINRNITNEVNKVEKIVLDLEFQNNGFNREAIKNALGGHNTMDVYAFWEKTIKSRGSALSPATQQIYESELKKLKEHKRSLIFSEITLEYLEGLEDWLRTIKKNKDNTIHKTMKCLTYIVGRANVLLKIKNDAFDYYKKPSEETDTIEIELDALDSLLNALFTNRFTEKSVNESIATFCLQALTGLRFSDAARFNPLEYIVNNQIKLRADKTEGFVYIPISDRMKKLLEFQKYSFNPPSNQATNRILKAVAIAIDIPVKLTTHVAVHSFCTISLELGIPLEVISKLRGHTTIKPTQRYAKVRNRLIKREMEKWDKIEETESKSA